MTDIIEKIEKVKKEVGAWTMPSVSVHAEPGSIVFNPGKLDEFVSLIFADQQKELLELKVRERELREALVYVAFSLYATEKYVLTSGITLIDNDAIKVRINGIEVDTTKVPDDSALRQFALEQQEIGAKAEREACAVFIDTVRYDWVAAGSLEKAYAAQYLSEAIRARSDASCQSTN